MQARISWLILTLVIFVPRLLNLDVFLTADEPLFLEHAQEFGAAILSGDYAETVGIGYPGVTVAAWAAAWVANAPETLATYAAGRFAVGLLTGLLLALLFGLSKKLIGAPAALIGVILLALDPYTLGYSRLLHIAAPLALLMTLAGVSFLLWLRVDQWRWLGLTALFTALALLTKSTGLLLGPMLAVIGFTWGVSGGYWRQLCWRRRQAQAGLLLVGLTAVIFTVLWPAMWVDPLGTLNLTFGKLFTDQAAGAGNLGLFWLGQFVEDPGPGFYPVAFLLKSTPWLLVGLVLSVYQLVKSQQTLGNKDQSEVGSREQEVGSREQEVTRREQSNVNHSPFTTSLSLWLFALTYLLIMTIASKKSIRYMLPAFPVFYLIAGSAFHQLFVKLKKKSPHLPISKSLHLPISQSPHLPISKSPHLQPILFLSLSLLLSLFAFIYHPYYLTYYNPLVLGHRWAPQTLLVGWGEGLDVAADYLNEKGAPGASAWYEWLFPLMYRGQVEAVVPQENMMTAEQTVLYINQVQRDIPGPNIIHYFRTRRQPEHTVRLNGIDYAWVYPGPIAGFGPTPTPQVPLGGEYGGEVRLLGYDLSAPAALSGDSLIVTLYWQALKPPAADRFVYLRLIDDRGHIRAKTDGPPVMGLWPVERWQPEMLIEDAHDLPIPAGTPPGVYRLEVGVYEPETGQPLAAGGQPLGQGGGLLLGEVPVEWQANRRADVQVSNPVDIELAPTISLIGYDQPPPAAATGDILPLQLVWRETGGWFQAAGPSEPDVIFSWVRRGERLTQQIEPLPLPSEQWSRGAALRTIHDIIVPPTLETGIYELRVSLGSREDSAERQPSPPPWGGQEGTGRSSELYFEAELTQQPSPQPSPRGRGSFSSPPPGPVLSEVEGGIEGGLSALKGEIEGGLYGDSFKLGALEVTAPVHQFELPAAAASPASPAQLAVAPEQVITLAGYRIELLESSLTAQLYWQTKAPVTTRYKVFAQLLDSGNQLVAQSDSVPAAGQRPTTGWLPGEIISDAHSLPLPEDLSKNQSYRLITGLYDPRSGRRLPVVDEAGDSVGDAIMVSDVEMNVE